MTIGGAIVRAFIGANGPFWSDDDVVHSVDPSEVIDDSVGFLIRDLVMGLMVMPPLVNLAEDNRPHFLAARRLLESLRGGLDPEQAKRHPLDQLSMGTSQDFKVAIEEGATWIRVGSEIFGPREEET